MGRFTKFWKSIGVFSAVCEYRTKKFGRLLKLPARIVAEGEAGRRAKRQPRAWRCPAGRLAFARQNRFELLEPRALLSGTPCTETPLIVSTLLDELDDNHGPGDLSLREALVEAAERPGEDRIRFAPDLEGGTLKLTLGMLEVNSSVVIEGPGSDRLTIDAQGQSRVVYADSGDDGGSIVLQGLTLTGGRGDEWGENGWGGGIYSSFDLTLIDVVLAGNEAVEFGGGLWQGFGDLELVNTLVVNNKTGSGGGVCVMGGTVSIYGSAISDNVARYRGGGGYFDNASLTFTDSVIQNNKCLWGEGGGIWNSGSMELVRSEISENTTGMSGGGIWSDGTLSLNGCAVSGNEATRFNGGGIHNQGSLTVENSQIGDNAAARLGGGIYLEERDDALPETVSVNTSLLQGNSALYGGGIYNQSALALDHATISSNQATVNGGGIYHARGTLEMARSVLSENAANLGGGIYNEANATLGDTVLTANTADIPTVSTPGILAWQSDRLGEDVVVVVGSNQGYGYFSFPWATSGRSIAFDINCTSETTGVRATVSEEGTKVQFISCDYGRSAYVFVEVLEGNFETTDPEGNLSVWNYGTGDDVGPGGECGGGIHNTGALSLDQVTFRQNMAGADGGGLCNGGTLDIDSSLFSENQAVRSGGGIANQDWGTLALHESRISGNVAMLHGGGVQNLGKMVIQQSTLSANVAGLGGGGLRNEEGTVEITSSTISGNSVTSGDGGGIFNDMGAWLDLANVTVSGNYVFDGQGGGLYNLGRMNVTNGTIVGNPSELEAQATPAQLFYCNPFLEEDAVLEVGSKRGYMVFAFEEGVPCHEIVDEINQYSDDLKIIASVLNDGREGLCLTTMDRGSDAFLSMKALSGHMPMTDAEGNPLDKIHGTGVSFGGDGIVTFSWGGGDSKLQNTLVNGRVIGWFDPAGAHNLLREIDNTSGLEEGAGTIYGTTETPLALGLAPLGDYGGSTWTHSLLPESPALDAGSDALASDAGLVQDQRGDARFADADGDGRATVDIGAVEAVLFGDLNGDGFVGSDDLDIVRSHWGEMVVPGNLLFGDLSGDGFVGMDDLSLVRSNWGRTAPLPPTRSESLVLSTVDVDAPRDVRQTMPSIRAIDAVWAQWSEQKGGTDFGFTPMRRFRMAVLLPPYSVV